jgi:hypothetical protein
MRKDSGFNLRFIGNLTTLKRRVREEVKYKRVVLFFAAHIDTKHQYGTRTSGMKLAGM